MDSGYGQFCTVARGAEILCERWTPLVIRELLCGSRRFNDLHRGVPRMSTSLLARRLQTLERPASCGAPRSARCGSTASPRPAEVITLDNVTIKVNAVLYFMVVDPQFAVVKVVDFIRATMQIAQTTLRSVVGQVELDELLARREAINERLQRIIDEQTEPWGVKVTIVEVKDVELPQSMQRAMAKQAEAEREKRAKIIHAEGEFQAS